MTDTLNDGSSSRRRRKRTTSRDVENLSGIKNKRTSVTSTLGLFLLVLLVALDSPQRQAFAFSFNLPVPSLVENTISGRAITARRAHRSTSSRTSPAPRMAIASAPESRRVTAPIPTPIISRSPPHVGLANTTGPAVGRGVGGGKRPDGKSPEFEVNLGRVISTLQVDYCKIFADPPSFDIYTDGIELFDPTGVAFRGIGNYKRVFATLRFFRQVLMKDAKTTFRLTYDWSKQQVRVTWNMVLVLKARQRPMHVDGISAYHINSDGNVYRHELETVVVNGTPVEPPFAYAWINLPAWVASPGSKQPSAIPAPYANGIVSLNKLFVSGPLDVDEFMDNKNDVDIAMNDLMGTYQTDPEVREDFIKTLTVLASSVDESPATSKMVDMVTRSGGGDGSSGSSKVVTKASKDEADDAIATAPRKARPIQDKKDGGWFGLQGPMECETSWDCTGGMVCCDYLLVKLCCSNGIRQPKFGDLIPSLVPIPGKGRNENDNPAPKRPQPRSRNGGSGKINW